MSWLPRNLFSRKRSSSQATDESKFSINADDAEALDLGPEPTDEEINNVDAIFARLSINEMRRYEQRVQQHVEDIRRQMRRVAGAHYPELIDAADSVASMRTVAADVGGQLSRLASMLHSTRTDIGPDTATHPVNADTGASSRDSSVQSIHADANNNTSSARVYAVAAQVKVLVDTPEQIWKALGQQRSLHAALLFLIAQEIHTRLRAQAHSADTSDVDPLLAFPVIERQWASVAPFGEQIAAAAHTALAAPDVELDASASAVCAIALLEDADAEMACTVFLARRGQTLQPVLDRMANTPGGDVAALATALHELLGRVRQILHDYVVLFGVSEGARGQFASRVLTTLTSISADVDLPTAPEPRELSPQDARAKRRSQLGSMSARRQRKSSLAGLMLSVPVSPMTDSFTFNDVRSPAPPPPPPGNGVFMVAKYLPPAVAQFRPQLPRMVDSCVLADNDVVGDSLNEADEDALGEYVVGLSALLPDPHALLRALATRAQPGLERIAAHALDLWWPDIVSSARDACTHAIGRHVHGVADAARVSADVRTWERDGAQPWMRGRSWTADPIIAHAAPLYEAVVEPLLVQRARALQGAAIDRALKLPLEFLHSAAIGDVLAGALPWKPLCEDARVAALRADVSAGLDVVPLAARALGMDVGKALRVAWRDAEAWWQQMGGAAVGPESAACAEHMARGWTTMTSQLEQWAESARAQAFSAISTDERLTLAGDLCDAEMPSSVMLCVKGAWAAHVLADEAAGLLERDDPLLLRECWRRQPASDMAAQRLRAIGSELLMPWLAHLGSSAALAWAAQFDHLYFHIPLALRQDTAATRRDVVHAWHAASQASADGPWSARYMALRRVAVTTTHKHTSGADVSAGVRILAAQLNMRVQAVCGLSALAEVDEWQRSVCEALVHSLDTVVATRTQVEEWDRAQLAADINFVIRHLGCSAHTSLTDAVHLNTVLPVIF
ncbi:hypothetical protein IWW50_000468 [Coemansia erecta]|nr:hypothetical protein IWW50_000468 [Coemansia erecta]